MGTRPKLGALLLENGLITERQLEEALRVHAETRRPLGEVLTDLLGVVSIAEVRDHLLLQRRWRPLGEMLVERGLLSDEQLVEALDEQERSGRPLGEIVRERFRLSSGALDRVLRDQRDLELELDRGYASGLRDALKRRSRGGAGTTEEASAAGREFGLAERLATPVSEVHTHVAMKQVEMGTKRIGELSALVEEQRREIVHLRDALADRQLTVIDLEARVAELEALLRERADAAETSPPS